MNEKQLKGSNTAKEGFKNEADVISKFNDWKNDIAAQEWLILMGYDLNEIEYVKAVKVSGEKTDVQVQVSIKLKEAIDVENLQVKLVSQKKGFNQIDKRWTEKYSELWNIPEDLTLLLKKFTGEIKPTIKEPRDKRRTHIDEFSKKNQEKITNWFNENKFMIINDIFRGRGRFSAEWYLVIRKIEINDWVLKSMNEVVNHYSKGEAVITPRGSIKLGKVGIQRKGGDGGRPTANMLQFKIDPTELFDI